MIMLDLFKITATVLNNTEPDRVIKAVHKLLVCDGIDTAVKLSKSVNFNVRLDPDEHLRIDSIENVTHSCHVHIKSVDR